MERLAAAGVEASPPEQTVAFHDMERLAELEEVFIIRLIYLQLLLVVVVARVEPEPKAEGLNTERAEMAAD
jgi:hypothetical protein